MLLELLELDDDLTSSVVTSVMKVPDCLFQISVDSEQVEPTTGIAA